MMYSLRTLVVALAAAIGTGACSLAEPARSVAPAPAQEKAVLEVTNHNWSDMVVYAVRSGMRHRLGMVTSMSTQRLALPRWLMQPGSDLRLMTDPIGDRQTFTTEPIQVMSGQRIEFTIENHLAISSYAAWSR